MNFLTATFFRTARRWLALAAVIVVAGGVRAADAPPPGRFLLVFETSTALKKNLPALRQTLDDLFSSNLQGEIKENDDLAVWTVDQKLHTGTFPLESWTPANAALYSARLKDFLGRQNLTRYASLDALQPLLNRVVKNSDRLTVLIFCDTQSRLLGTPYDGGVNEVLTNSAPKTKGTPPPVVLVLRSYHGEYLGCSVNRTATLNFPKFPPPPAPPPPPVVKPPPVTAPRVVTPPVAVAPVPALIIVGTNASTNVSALTKPLPPPVAIAVTNPPATNPPPPAPKVVAAPVTNPPPVSNPPVLAKPQPLPAPVNQQTSAPEPVASAPANVTHRFANVTNPLATVANPPAALASNSAGATEVLPEASSRWPLFVGGGALVAAVGLAVWLAARARRPRGSLITSSMLDDHLPPRKK